MEYPNYFTAAMLQREFGLSPVQFEHLKLPYFPGFQLPPPSGMLNDEQIWEDNVIYHWLDECYEHYAGSIGEKRAQHIRHSYWAHAHLYGAFYPGHAYNFDDIKADEEKFLREMGAL